MDWVANIGGGIVASLIAVFITWLWSRWRRHLDRRPIRRVLGEAIRFGVVTPSYPATRTLETGGQLTTDNAYALAFIIEACRSIGAEVELSPVEPIAAGLPDDLILLGGQVANELTGDALGRHCPGFHIHGSRTNADASEVIYYECGDRPPFLDTDEEAWGFIAKLGRDITDEPSNTILTWGRSSVGTAAAAYVLSNRTEKLKGFGKSSFLVGFTISKRLGYRSKPTRFFDLSKDAFSRDAAVVEATA